MYKEVERGKKEQEIERKKERERGVKMRFWGKGKWLE